MPNIRRLCISEYMCCFEIVGCHRAMDAIMDAIVNVELVVVMMLVFNHLFVSIKYFETSVKTVKLVNLR